MPAELSKDITEKALVGITIPPCPAVLTSIMREIKRPSADFHSIAHVISQDAGIVGPLLKLANSPLVGLHIKVTSVFQAISTLGMQNTLNLVQNISLRQSMTGNSQNFEKFWERSSLAASIAEKIASKFPAVSKDDAYIAALFHDCGIPVLIMKFPEYRKVVMAQYKPSKTICEVENENFSTNHPVVGNLLTRSWTLPANVSKAILYHHDSEIFNLGIELVSTEVRNLIGIIHMAEYIVDEHLNVRERDWPLFEQVVLEHFEITEQEFSELKDDILAFLNGE